MEGVVNNLICIFSVFFLCFREQLILTVIVLCTNKHSGVLSVVCVHTNWDNVALALWRQAKHPPS